MRRLPVSRPPVSTAIPLRPHCDSVGLPLLPAAARRSTRAAVQTVMLHVTVSSCQMGVMACAESSTRVQRPQHRQLRRTPSRQTHCRWTCRRRRRVGCQARHLHRRRVFVAARPARSSVERAALELQWPSTSLRPAPPPPCKWHTTNTTPHHRTDTTPVSTCLPATMPP